MGPPFPPPPGGRKRRPPGWVPGLDPRVLIHLCHKHIIIVLDASVAVCCLALQPWDLPVAILGRMPSMGHDCPPIPGLLYLADYITEVWP